MISDEGLKKWMQFGIVRQRDMRLGGRHVPRGDLHSARVRGEHNLGSMVACQVYQVWARFLFEQVLTPGNLSTSTFQESYANITNVDRKFEKLLRLR